MKQKTGVILMILIVLAGLSLCLYPIVSNSLHERAGSQSIARYDESVSGLSGGAGEEELGKAEAYNRALLRASRGQEPTGVSASDYDSLLNWSGDGMMGYVEIPSIQCRLPICHGTDAAILESYVGHMPSSSLPVGGAGTHCVLTGHTGIPSAKLLTDLDKVGEGDRFTLTVLDRKLTYEVDQILVVKPNETEALRIVEGEDYCTLITCTPYGVNTHRLLVRGHRVSGALPEEAAPDPLEFLYSPVMIVLAVLLLLLMMIYVFTRNRDKRRR